MITLRTAFALVAAAAFAACASMAPVPTRVADGVVTGANGMTLYTFDKDATGSGRSVCNGQCAINWPPLYADNNAQASGSYSVVTRDDGRKQWALRGKPLYYWVKDSRPGDKTGEGVGNAWWVAKP